MATPDSAPKSNAAKQTEGGARVIGLNRPSDGEAAMPTGAHQGAVSARLARLEQAVTELEALAEPLAERDEATLSDLADRAADTAETRLRQQVAESAAAWVRADLSTFDDEISRIDGELAALYERLAAPPEPEPEPAPAPAPAPAPELDGPAEPGKTQDMPEDDPLLLDMPAMPEAPPTPAPDRSDRVTPPTGTETEGLTWSDRLVMVVGALAVAGALAAGALVSGGVWAN